MTIKTFLPGIAIAIFTSVLTAVLTVVATDRFSKPAQVNEISAPELPTSWQKFKNVFSFAEAETQVLFVEISNIVITLKNDGGKERYLLLELALTTSTEDTMKQTEMMIPAIRGSTVALLTEKDYSVIRSLAVNDLRNELMTAYQERFKQLKTPMPFNDVIISKMLLQ